MTSTRRAANSGCELSVNWRPDQREPPRSKPRNEPLIEGEQPRDQEQEGGVRRWEMGDRRWDGRFVD